MRSRPLLYFCLKIHTLFWNNPISYLRMASCFQLSCQAEKMMYFEPKHYNSATISTNFYQILNTSLTDLHASWSWLTHTHTHTHTRACMMLRAPCTAMFQRCWEGRRELLSPGAQRAPGQQTRDISDLTFSLPGIATPVWGQGPSKMTGRSHQCLVMTYTGK